MRLIINRSVSQGPRVITGFPAGCCRVMQWLFLALGLILPLESLAIDLKEYPLLTPLRLELTREYCKQHYGLDTYNLVNPRMIVIHFTGTDSLEGSLGTFKPETIATSRVYVKKFGKVNVGVHFLISKAGEIYSLLPENIIGRHTIGFNHLSLGVELVSSTAEGLTEEQLMSTAVLVDSLVDKYPTLEYLIGHHEYVDKDLPHYQLYRELDPDYAPTVKVDTGDRFMVALRKILFDLHSIQLLK